MFDFFEATMRFPSRLAFKCLDNLLLKYSTFGFDFVI